ncbi:MAG: bifunctional riboflavin kinase/FAD synthetase [Candidatus Omnitrophota bacterium]
MKIIYGLHNLKYQHRRSVVSIGIFDGVHMGHRLILKELIKQAKKKKQVSCVITFYPHPRKVLGSINAKSTITSLKHRLELLKATGIDLCVVINFTTAFSKMSVKWFIRQVLVKKLKATKLVVGSRFKLGRQKLSAGKLKRILAAYGLDFKAIPTKKFNGKVISSSLIRSLIEKGKLATASRLLARDFAITGTVIRGRGIGRTIGFKTANIDPLHEAIPPAGVYTVKVKIGNRCYKGVLNIGFRPTFALAQKEPSIEVHILSFKGSLYNKALDISFIKRIRPEKHFKDRRALREQIKKDILYII